MYFEFTHCYREKVNQHYIAIGLHNTDSHFWHLIFRTYAPRWVEYKASQRVKLIIDILWET